MEIIHVVETVFSSSRLFQWKSRTFLHLFTLLFPLLVVISQCFGFAGLFLLGGEACDLSQCYSSFLYTKNIHIILLPQAQQEQTRNCSSGNTSKLPFSNSNLLKTSSVLASSQGQCCHECSCLSCCSSCLSASRANIHSCVPPTALALCYQTMIIPLPQKKNHHLSLSKIVLLQYF